MNEVYAAYSTDRNIRAKSSSGGIFYHLARKIIKNNGVVFGAAWTSDWQVEMKSASTLEELEPLLKSKYVKADVKQTFKACQELLSLGKLVLYAGLPCQIAALKAYLKQDYSNLFCVEICCHGTMPINIWQDYINVLQTKYGPITDINMRDKCKGWHNLHVTIKFKSGKILSESSRTNAYMKAFLSDKYLFNACYTCQFKQGASGADLCIGDFWGVQVARKHLDDNLGCSFISVYSQSGKDLLNTLLDEIAIEQISPEEIFRYNSGPKDSIDKARISQYNKAIFNEVASMTEITKTLPKKLGIITLHLHTNIGGILQAYALQKTLKELGYDSDVITYDLNNDPRRHLKFVDTHIKVKKVLYETKFTDIKPTDYDGFVVGSDQIWRKRYSSSFFGQNFLDFAASWPVKKITYGPSLGVGLDDWEYSVAEENKIIQWLNNFSAISCRELDGTEIIKSKFKHDCTNVCDPTLLLKKEDYLDLCKSIPTKQGEVFTYVLDKTTEATTAINTFIHKHNLTEMPCDLSSVEDWLAAFRDCKYVITDSFHACIFSIIFNKPFICVANLVRGRSRFDTLIKKFNVDKNIIPTWSQLNVATFNAPDTANLLSFKQTSYSWLKNALKKERAMDSKDNKLDNSTKVCLCGIGKLENNYVREWVEHHKKLGFNKIFLYDNNDVDGERFEDVIGDYVKSGYVEILDVRGEPNRQISAYDELYHGKAKAYDWVAYFDIDEFLFLDNAKSIQEFVNDRKYTAFNEIAINWKYYDDNGQVGVVNNHYACLDRFTHEHLQPTTAKYPEASFTKRLVKCNIPGVVVNSSHGPLDRTRSTEAKYCATLKNPMVHCCNVEGCKVSPINGTAIQNWSHNGAHLKHFRFKTIEEYITKKMKRGYPTLYRNCGKDLNIIDFFRLNATTEEKKQKAAECLDLTIDQVNEIINAAGLKTVCIDISTPNSQVGQIINGGAASKKISKNSEDNSWW